MEDVIGGELPRGRRIIGGGGVDGDDAPPNLGREGTIHMAVPQALLPDGMDSRVKIGHGEETARRIVAEDRRHRIGDDGPSRSHPGHLVEVALHRRPPIGGDLQFRERPFHGEDAAVRFDL